MTANLIETRFYNDSNRILQVNFYSDGGVVIMDGNGNLWNEHNWIWINNQFPMIAADLASDPLSIR